MIQFLARHSVLTSKYLRLYRPQCEKTIYFIVIYKKRVPESQSLEDHDFFFKNPCLAPNICETTELNQKKVKNLLNNFLYSIRIRKHPVCDIGTLNIAQRRAILPYRQVYFKCISSHITVKASFLNERRKSYFAGRICKGEIKLGLQ